MKSLSFFLLLQLLAASANCQSTTSRIDILTLYSENGNYYLRSIPFDSELESIFGKTYVFKVGQAEPLYIINRHFNYSGYPNKIQLSNNGKSILYVNDAYANNELDELKPITVYNNGRLVKTYTRGQLSTCDENKTDCYLLYRNKDAINRDSTTWENQQMVLGFKPGTSAKERFANQLNIFSRNDSFYLVNQFKQVKIFDLLSGTLVDSTDFDSHYNQLQVLSRINSFKLETMDSPPIYELPLLKSGKRISEALADQLGMVTMKSYGEEDNLYKRYTVVVNAIINIDGKLEIHELDAHDELPEKEIRDFLEAQSFNMKDVPRALERWRFNEYIHLRNKSKAKAKSEKEQEKLAEKKAYLQRLTKDTIRGFYIPKDIGDCMPQLDSLLKQKDKDEMKALPTRSDMINYHHGLGTYLRNNWGLWGGSRLQKYFLDRGVGHPDSMSGIILSFYHDWLNGKRESWKTWEQERAAKNKPDGSKN